MIPEELRALPQWVCAGSDKVPIDPKTRRPADVTDPSTWGTYEQAVAAGYPHVGFVLTEQDPYTIIDLDAPRDLADQQRQHKILEAFNTYVEWSQSGRGLHIICRGSVPRGVRRDRVEVYSSARYMICTGRVYRNIGIRDCQEMLDRLFAEMNPTPAAELRDGESVLSDRGLVDMAMRASNADKFNRLCAGEWQGEYPSQSEADFALLSILAFYTQDNEQVRRLFRMSALGKRDKAVRDDKYLNYALSKIRATQPPPVDFSSFALPSPAPEPKPELAVTREIPRPPGLVGDLADYIYRSSGRPVWEVSLTAALALVAGICGRHYNISGAGLNQYIILLAKTGTGKEEGASGVDRLLNATRSIVPMVDQFIGPGAFASGQAIIRALDEQPSMVAILGEFGLTLQVLSDPQARSNDLILKRVLLDLYSKSGWGKVLRSSVYSDKEKNTKTVISPNLTLLGESTPEAFYDGLSETQIAEGLIPRFLILEYTGERPSRNPNAYFDPPPELVQRLADLCTTVLFMQNNGTCAMVDTEPDALALLDAFDAECDQLIRSGPNEVTRQLWNRAHLKALKLAGLLAVGVNHQQPIVRQQEARWAIDLVRRDAEAITTRFERGDIGTGDSKQLADLRRLIQEYQTRPFDKVAKYGVTQDMYQMGVVPFVYLQRRTANLSAFKTDRRGATSALRTCLQALVDSGELVEIPKTQLYEKFGTSQLAFAIVKAQ